MDYLNAFLCGGILCAIGQILIDRTQLTPARILTGYVVAGVLLSAWACTSPLPNGAAPGATVPPHRLWPRSGQGRAQGGGPAGMAGRAHRRPGRRLPAEFPRRWSLPC